MNSCPFFFLIYVNKFYKCVIGIDEYKSNIHYFISGKIYEVKEDITGPDLKLCIIDSDIITLIDELGEYHRMLSDVFRIHFKPLMSNKRKRHECKARKML